MSNRADRVRDTATGTGTSTLTLANAAPTGRRTPVAVWGTGTYDIDYCAEMGAEWEVGRGSFNGTTLVLTRTTIFSSSNGGAAVNFSAGTKDIFVQITADQIVDTDQAQTISGAKTFSNDVTISGAKALRGSYGAGGITDNFAAGTQALSSNTTGNQNTAVGYGALYLNTVGQNATAFGCQALRANTNGSGNTAIGSQTLKFNTTGGDNTAVGYQTLQSNTTGEGNTGVGVRALFSNIGGTGNTAVGANSLLSNTTGVNNVVVGSEGLYNNTTGTENVAIGYLALRANTYGNSNIAIGYQALKENVTGEGNVAIGRESLLNQTDAGNNTAVGTNTLRSNTTGGGNVAVGYAALTSNTVGIDIVAIGATALYSNTTGINNVAVGSGALFGNTIGISNVAVGKEAASSNTTGNYNTAVGFQALRLNTTGSNNTAIGFLSLYSNIGGSRNVALGRYAGYYETGSDAFYIDNQDRTDTAGDKANALLYGKFAAAPVDQELTVNASLQVQAFASNTVTNSAGTYTQLKSDNTIIQTTAASVYTLLSAATYPGREITIVTQFAGTVTSASSNVVPQAGGSAGTAILAATAGAFARLKSNGTNWVIIESGGVAGGGSGDVTAASAFGTDNLLIRSDGTGKGVQVSLITVDDTGNLVLSGAGALRGSYGAGSVTSNFVVGDSALATNTTGINNLAIGQNALAANTTGTNNIAIGLSALALNTTGVHNLAIGPNALDANTTGTRNVAIGQGSLGNNSFGSNNIAIGQSALSSNTTGSDNTSVGWAAITGNTTGSRNTGVGKEALFANTSGSDNTAIGYQALDSNTTGNNNTVIGSAALSTNTVGTNNVALGFSAGRYETGSNAFYIDNQDRTNTAGDKANAILYGVMASTTANQSLTANVKTFSVAGTDARINLTGITTEPSASPADTLHFYTKKIAGRMVPKIIGPSGIDTALQNAFWRNNIVMWSTTTATAGVWLGTAGAGAGTYTTQLPTTTSLYTSQKRARYANVITTANQVLGQRNTEAMFFAGNTAGQGGFMFYASCGFDVWTNAGRFFAGMATGTTVISAEPSALNNTVGFCIDAADATGAISFLTKGTGAATKASTGFSAATGNGYELFIFVAPNSSSYGWLIKDINAGTEASGIATATPPTVNTKLTANVLASNAALTPATSIQLGISKIYVETDR